VSGLQQSAAKLLPLGHLIGADAFSGGGNPGVFALHEIIVKV
jgi:hypothetical protein